MDSNTKLYIVLYNHRHGVDVWPVYRTEEPSSEEILKELKAAEEWDERDEADELTYIEVRGPFPLVIEKNDHSLLPTIMAAP